MPAAASFRETLVRSLQGVVLVKRPRVSPCMQHCSLCHTKIDQRKSHSKNRSKAHPTSLQKSPARRSLGGLASTAPVLLVVFHLAAGVDDCRHRPSRRPICPFVSRLALDMVAAPSVFRLATGAASPLALPTPHTASATALSPPASPQAFPRDRSPSHSPVVRIILVIAHLYVGNIVILLWLSGI